LGDRKKIRQIAMAGGFLALLAALAVTNPIQYVTQDKISLSDAKEVVKRTDSYREMKDDVSGHRSLENASYDLDMEVEGNQELERAIIDNRDFQNISSYIITYDRGAGGYIYQVSYRGNLLTETRTREAKGVRSNIELGPENPNQTLRNSRVNESLRNGTRRR
jgi:hypothetical protein